MTGVLKDKAAVVTGSGQGIGRAIALAMSREGARVVVNDVIPEMADQVAREIVDSGGQAEAFPGDISRFDTAQKMIGAALEGFGRVDVLINNAGVVGPSWIWDMTEDNWDRVIGVSLKGAFNCVFSAGKLMKEQGWGRIISATSTSALGSLETCAYAAAKAGVMGLTHALARELGPYGITCNAYAPTAGTQMTLSEGAKNRFRKRYEAGVYSKQKYDQMLNPPVPDSIAPLIVYLSTDEASDINGQIFRIDGNRIALFSAPLENNPIHKETGLWTFKELKEIVPKELMKGYQNPAPRLK
ncbi:MAG: SDR family oxidoreductase [Desulfobacteraceae bacterium]|nr:MAG: SDR family oxidoreductase [Desulfobacteraceae bacterium]